MTGRSEAGRKLDVTTLHIPKRLLAEVDALVERGLFTSRSEAVRFAILLLLKEYKPPRGEKPEVGYR